MIKNAKIEINKTPSIVSGKPATKIVAGEALSGKERLPKMTAVSKQPNKIL